TKHICRSRTGRWRFCFRTGKNAASPEKPHSRISWLYLVICSKAFFSRLALTAFSSPFPRPKNVTWESKNRKDVTVGRPTKIEARTTWYECAANQWLLLAGPAFWFFETPRSCRRPGQ